MSQTLGAGDGSVLITGNYDNTLDGIVIPDGVVIYVIEGVIEINTLGDDDRSIGFAFIASALGEQYGVI